MFKRIAAAFAGIAVGMTVLFAPTASASAPKSVCDTGHRGQPAYDRACLRTGTAGDAALLWFVSMPEGRKGKERDGVMTRRSICKYAPRHGGLKAWATDAVFDVTYDSYRNNKAVNGWVVDIARADCKRMGYRV